MTVLKDFQITASFLAAEEGEGEAKKEGFEGLAYSGGPLQLGLDMPVYIDLSRFEAEQRKPVLYDHQKHLPIGFTTSCEVDPIKGLRVAGKWLKPVGATYEEMLAIEKVRGYVEQGYPWELSVGARPYDCATLEADQKQIVNGREVVGPALICGAKLREISVTVLGADEETFAIAATKPEEPPMTIEATQPAPTQPAKKAATIAELKAQFPGESDFVLDCAEKGLGLLEASAAFVPILQKRLAEAKSSPAPQPAPTPAPIQASGRVELVQAQSAVNTLGLDAPNATPPAQTFLAIYDGHIKAGMTRPEAIRAAVVQNPQLHRDFLKATSKPRRD